MRKGLIKWFVLGAVAWLGVFLFRKSRAISRLEVYSGAYKDLLFDFGYVVWYQEISIMNPENVTISTNNLKLDVFVKGLNVGTCSFSNYPVLIDKVQNVYSVRVVCTKEKLLNAYGYGYTDLITGGELNVDFKGEIGWYGFTKKIEFSGTV